ncbi:hypothetical protein LZD49_32380 [Dyadobacter sp. CY261]|uniref:hypothetical protein n=1 Tax=Dyadobacter sp. CY261 TaxID=2907203 RepID=UPI001F365A91|nr:hypothetical protein [Dyadobacter sp. CY261]MCF0075225.1 hypothetical protein [Dyadobacter sp. CY261]
MDTIYNFQEKEYRISESVWRTLIDPKFADDPLTLKHKVIILKLIGLGFRILRDDGRILGYDLEKDHFFDTGHYFGKEQDLVTEFPAKVVLQFVFGVLIYGLVVFLGRMLLKKEGLPTETPGMIHLMALPDRIEYLEKEAASMDSGRMERIIHK